MTTIALNPPTAATEPRVRVRLLLKSEWIKLRSLRSIVLGLVLAAAGVLYCNVNAVVADRRFVPHGAFVLSDVFTNNAHIVVLYVFGSLGAMVIVSEYGSGLIRATFAAVPDRTVVIAAKSVVVTAVTAVVGLVTVAASYVAVALILGSSLTLDRFRSGDVRLYVVASVALFPVSALVGLGLGVLVRHTAIATIGVTTVLAVLPQFVESQKYAWVNDLHNATPFAAWQRLRMGSAREWQGGAFGNPTITGSWLVYAAWPLIAMALALVAVRRRDV
jgi:ABC-type transport system involved in multi-copper enzyme maturation permease subunit